MSNQTEGADTGAERSLNTGTEERAEEEQRQIAEESRETAEHGRNEGETFRQDAETLRQANENMRQEMAELRQFKESIRQMSEEVRLAHEQARMAAEEARDHAEAARTLVSGLQKVIETWRLSADQQSQLIAEVELTGARLLHPGDLAEAQSPEAAVVAPVKGVSRTAKD